MSNHHHYKNSQDNEEEEASLSSEDSQEPYFHVESGRIIMAREAWNILAREGHPRFSRKLSSCVSDGGSSSGGGSGGNGNRNENNTGGAASKIGSSTPSNNLNATSTPSNNNEGNQSNTEEIFRSRVNTASTDSSGGNISLGAGVVTGDKDGDSVVNLTATTAMSAAIDEASKNVASAQHRSVSMTVETQPPPPPPLQTNPTDDSLSNDTMDGVGEVEIIQSASSFSSGGGDVIVRGPTQSSIDRALHPDGLLSANIRNNIHHHPNPHNISSSSKNLLSNAHTDTLPPELKDDTDDEETDPIILRAKAMALAAKNGAKLTPAQMQLIAQPDVQQQKLIEEARRRGQTHSHHGNSILGSSIGGGGNNPLGASLGGNLERIGADFKKFVETEKSKPPMQWGADLGKFIEEQKSSLKLSTGGGGCAGEGGESSSEPHLKKKMEGFGTDPFAEDNTTPPNKTKKSLIDSMLVLPGASKKNITPTEPATPTRKALGEDGETPSVTPFTPGRSSIFAMPPLPTLNTSTIAGMLPGVGGEKDQTPPQNEPLRVSAVLWKRRSGMGKHSSKAWEKRRVELRGTKVMYYKTVEEEQEEKKALSGDGAALAPASSANNAPRDPSDKAGVLDNVNETANASNVHSSITEAIPPPPMTSKKYSIFEHAALAAEKKIQDAKDEISRMSVAIGIEKPSSVDDPRGILDLCKEKATVSASMGHSGSPTPFCISIKVKSETKWKFCFENHLMQMEWLAAMTDVVVQASVDANKSGGVWEMEDYCIRRNNNGDSQINEGAASETTVLSVSSLKSLGREVSSMTAGSEVSAPQYAVSNVEHTVETLVDDESDWMIGGLNLKIAWAVANLAAMIARARSTTPDQYWMMVVFANVGVWQLCCRPKVLKKAVSNRPAVRMPVVGPGSPQRSIKQGENDAAVIDTPLDRSSYKPVAGHTTLKVSNVDDSGFTKDGLQFPTWLPVSSASLDVRSHGYLSTKKKIPSPGELYECIGVDCFASNTRFGDIAPRVVLPDVTFDDGDSPKTWKSPDIFVASIAIPTEAPKLGRSTDDGPGTTFVGYFKMKEETRAILRRTTAPGYDSSTDTTESGTDVQKRLTNAVRLFEEWCTRSPTDPTFQARIKLISQANLTELGCPSYIEKYNGKPVLIKRNGVTGFLSDYSTLNAMEFDISLHPFPYLFKQAMVYLKENIFDKAIVTFGFVIEGRKDDELPECVIGAMKVCRPSPKYIVNGEDFFAGICPKSSTRKQ